MQKIIPTRRELKQPDTHVCTCTHTHIYFHVHLNTRVNFSFHKVRNTFLQTSFSMWLWLLSFWVIWGLEGSERSESPVHRQGPCEVTDRRRISEAPKCFPAETLVQKVGGCTESLIESKRHANMKTTEGEAQLARNNKLVDSKSVEGHVQTL